jgi:hypothetical protein
MNEALKRATPLVFLLVGGTHPQSGRAHRVWQADIQIRTLEVTRGKTTMSARVVIYSDNDDDAQDARLLILLPVGVGIERLDPGCAASRGPSMVPALRAAVMCEMGAIHNRGFREVTVTTTLATEPFPKRFGVFTYSSTPDPSPGNNYAERTIP